jgi:hypothetical protein
VYRLNILKPSNGENVKVLFISVYYTRLSKGFHNIADEDFCFVSKQSQQFHEK